MNLKGKNILILGLGRSGIAAAIKVSELGANVIANDNRDTIKNIDSIKPYVKNIVLGNHPLELLKNCDLIIVSPGVPDNIDILEKAREKNIPIISELELGYRLVKSPIIAITGTNGKTTTTTLIGEILKNDGKKVIIAGNIGTPLVEEVNNDKEANYIVLEVSSFQLQNIMHFRPKISVILNITEDHLNRHKTFDRYISAKAKILKNQNKNDFTVLNADDDIVSSFANYSKANVVFFSRKKELDEGVYVKDGVIVVKRNGSILPVLKSDELGIKGKHNLENALAAICVGVILGINLNTIAETLKVFRGVEHRLEYVTTISGVRFINDSKGTNPDASIKAIEAIDGPLILIAGGYNKNSDFSDFVKAFEDKVKELILIGETAHVIGKEAKKCGFSSINFATSMHDAVFLAYKLSQPGDTVLLSPACASWDMFKSFEERGRVFKDAVYSLKSQRKG